MHPAVHCQCQSVSCCSRSSVEQFSITRHFCIPSLHLLLLSYITSLLTFVSHFLALLSFGQCLHCDILDAIIVITFTFLRFSVLQVEIVLERAHAIDESNDASSAVIARDSVIKTLIFQKADIVMMSVADINLDYAIVGVLLTVHLLQDFL